MKRNFMILSAFLLVSYNVKALDLHAGFFSDSPIEYVRKVPGDFLVFMRSNPRWSWAWFYQNVTNCTNTFTMIAKYEGTVGGDIKPDNIDIVVSEKKGKAKIGLIDLDDGGHASLIGDLFHTLSYNKVWPVSIPAKDAFNYYIAGLSDRKPSEVLRPLIEIAKDVKTLAPSKDFDKKVKKMAASEENFLSELKLTRIHEAPSEFQEIYAKAENDIQKNLKKIGTVIYSGLRLKDSGGSMGSPRFTFLVNSQDEYKIIEIKYQLDSAVTGYEPDQKNHEKRITDLINIYRPFEDSGSILNILKTSVGYFIVRERGTPVFDAGKAPTNPELRAIHEEFIKHMFWWMGKRHLTINPEYANAMLAKKDLITSDLFQLVEDHVRESKDIFNSYKNSSATP